MSFFEAFPDSWPSFISTYGYSDAPGYDLAMYNKYADHCDAFALRLTEIDSKTYAGKLVEIAVGAGIDTDAPNALRAMQHNAMKLRRKSMLEAISSMLRSDRLLYWQFYWSSTLANESDSKEFDELYRYMLNIGMTDEAELMKEAFDNFYGKASLISSGHIGHREFENKDY